jgi:hypothetical protein
MQGRKLQLKVSAPLLPLQMTRMLDLLQSYLEQLGHTACRIDGSIPWQERQENIRSFNEDKVREGRVALGVMASQAQTRCCLDVLARATAAPAWLQVTDCVLILVHLPPQHRMLTRSWLAGRPVCSTLISACLLSISSLTL